MTKLNLITSSSEEERIKEYLENNANDILAYKINNGVKLVKNDVTIINKKDLSGFMKFASEEARKCMTGNKGFVCIGDKTVFGWAMHYFEEDSIEGTLYNEDGIEYKPIKETKSTVEQPKIEQLKPKKEDKQLNLFDMFSENNLDEEIEEKHEEIMQENVQENSFKIKEKIEINPNYERYISLKGKYKNAIILIKLGDFYESFLDNAELLSNKLDLTLIYKDVGLKNKVAMVGFPIHKLSDI